ncbi:GntR family transcriptional regulator [Corticibacter populi]|uniref:GntR family transcriptional regulator n=2 Tax=Corticibacter populi TaxID=1550736 RepID=A0A3M6QXL0_9BURK|nr:GntR family transcriptional regulator [Corticibacter populi]RZS34966.1 GntR family transcriptional regulator [Corticibacter populi]
MLPGQDIYHFASTAEEDAYRHIHAAIRLGRYQAGQRLVPETIAAEIGTSRMPVREAFRRLAAEGLVTIRPNRGAVVTGLDVADMQEIFEMRAVLEGLAVRLALPNVTRAVLQTLDELLDRIDDRDENLADWTTAHRHFHETLCRLSGRPRLVRQIASLHSLVEPHMRLWINQVESRPSARGDHQHLLDALRDGDPLLCEQAMRAHVLDTVPDLLALLPPAVTSRHVVTKPFSSNF